MKYQGREIATGSVEKYGVTRALHSETKLPASGGEFKRDSNIQQRRTDTGESFDERYKRFQTEHERKYQVTEPTEVNTKLTVNPRKVRISHFKLLINRLVGILRIQRDLKLKIIG